MPAPDAVAPKPVDVAVGILMRPNGDVLLGQRPAGNHVSAYDLSNMFHKASDDDGAGPDHAHAH